MIRLEKRTFVLGLWLAACASDTDNISMDAAVTDTAVTDTAVDSAQADAAQEDASATPDAGHQETKTDLVATFEVTRGFELGVFGKNKDGTLHIEAHGDAAAMDCSVQEGAPPGRTLTMNSVPTGVGTHAVAAVLFDFEGALTNEPLLRADSASVHVRGFAEDEQLWAEVDVRLSGGAIVGSLYAMHCPSLDEP